jgi:hypothetical protein
LEQQVWVPGFEPFPVLFEQQVWVPAVEPFPALLGPEIFLAIPWFLRIGVRGVGVLDGIKII